MGKQDPDSVKAKPSQAPGPSETPSTGWGAELAVTAQMIQATLVNLIEVLEEETRSVAKKFYNKL